MTYSLLRWVQKRYHAMRWPDDGQSVTGRLKAVEVVGGSGTMTVVNRAGYV
jgi:hypothetical protein